MALSNIFREPRREIVETLIGVVIIGGLIYADYRFGVWWAEYSCSPEDNSAGYCNGQWALGMLIGLAGLMVSGLLVFLAHELGEAICDRLQSAGVHLRPKVRR